MQLIKLPEQIEKQFPQQVRIFRQFWFAIEESQSNDVMEVHTSEALEK